MISAPQTATIEEKSEPMYTSHRKPYSKKNKRTVHHAMAPVYLAQEELSDVYENLDDLINGVTTRN
jgi:hypothetical protein